MQEERHSNKANTCYDSVLRKGLMAFIFPDTFRLLEIIF